MLFIIFAFLGVAVGLAIIKLTRHYRETGKSRIITIAPSGIAIILAVFLMYLGNAVVEGTNGAAFMLLSMIIFCFGGVVLYVTDKKLNSKGNTR
ncbi:hypothetical protein VBD025_04360 [Virgibacillus flavescens]|uniref:hypothetical protein n=1 Tax=Virgibacillus flavescens TaxID=1611422 RepID=UPI003D34FE7B